MIKFEAYFMPKKNSTHENAMLELRAQHPRECVTFARTLYELQIVVISPIRTKK